MSRYAELTDTATTRMLETVQPVEDLTLKLAGAVDGVVTKLPSLPRHESLPTTVEVLDAHFAVAERLLAAQKDFLLRVLSGGAASPLVVPAQSEPVITPTSTKV
jgi:hypothetical protein